MKCKNCGNEVSNEAKYCSVCGEVIEKQTEDIFGMSEIENEPVKSNGADKCAKIGFKLGLFGLIFCWIGIGADLALVGIILCSIGKKSLIEGKAAKKGLTLSIIGFIIGSFFQLLYLILLTENGFYLY